jgi:hypothetical protein
LIRSNFVHRSVPHALSRFLTVVAALLMALACISGLSQPLHAWADTVSDGQFVPLTPTTVLDTGTGTVAQVPANGSVTVQVPGQGGVPSSGVSAVALNVVALHPEKFGWINVYPSDASTNVSTITFSAGENASGLDFTRITSTGKVTFFNHSDGRPTCRCRCGDTSSTPPPPAAEMSTSRSVPH